MSPGGGECMGEFEAIGDAMTGGVLGRAVEPKSGEAGDGHTRESNCLNCGTRLDGPYCRECGQHAHVHRTLGAFFHDFAHGVLHFEGKIWRTLPLLVWKPGELTRRYVEGQRASFVSPIALFLFSVFLMFAVIHAVGAPDFSGENKVSINQDARQKKDVSDALETLRKQRAEAVAAGKSTTIQDAAITQLESRSGSPSAKQSRKAMDVSLGPELEWLQDPLNHAMKNPDLLLYKIQSNAYKFSWLLIPISVPFVWLLLLHRRRYRQFGVYDHTVFVTYSLAFATLVVVAATLVGKLVRSNDLAVMAISIIPPVHMYRQLRGAYDLSRFSAAWRALALAIFALIALSIFILILVALGAFD